MQIIEWVDHIDLQDRKEVGNKAAYLGKLARGELLIPPTFVITTDALDGFLKENDLSTQLRSILEGSDPEDGSGLSRRADAIAELFSKGNLPWNVEIDIMNAYHRLSRDIGMKEAPVAVRCSFCSKSDPDKEFVGPFRPQLNIKGEGQLLDAIRSQWASLYSPSIISERLRSEASFDDLCVGVIVQGMVAPEVSGIVLTKDPSHEGDLMTIKAVYGHPISLQREEVIPDLYIIDRETDNFWDKQLSNQSWKYVIDEKGSPVKEDVDRYTQSFQKLFNEQVLQLARLGMRCEKLFNTPLAIEWCLQSNDLIISQVTPLSSVATPSENSIAPTKVEMKEDIAGYVKTEEPQDSPADGFSAFFGEIEDTTANEAPKGELEHSPFLHLPTTSDDEGSTPPKYSELKGEDHGEGHQIQRKMLVYVDLKDPQEARQLAKFPLAGVCSLNMDELFRRYIRIHPLQVLEEGIEKDVLNELVEIILDVASAFHPREVLIKTSAGTTVDFLGLKGGSRFEPKEPNPSLGLRGGLRYLSEDFSQAFHLELRAIGIAKKEMEGSNIGIVLPYLRTPDELGAVLRTMADVGLDPQESPGVFIAGQLPTHALRVSEFLSGVSGVCVDVEQMFLSSLGYDPLLSEGGIQIPPWASLPTIDPLLEMISKGVEGTGTQLIASNFSSMIGPKLLRNLRLKGFDGICVEPEDIEPILKLLEEIEGQDSQ